jgi:hypothetical protein
LKPFDWMGERGLKYVRRTVTTPLPSWQNAPGNIFRQSMVYDMIEAEHKRVSSTQTKDVDMKGPK